MEKTCRLCGREQPLENFYPAKGMRDGRRNECKACFKERAAARYRANPEPVKERVRRWQRENPEKQAARMREYRASGRRSEVDRRSHLKRRFGITPEQYESMLEAQGGRCAICRRRPRADIALHVDHEHESGEIRGLLCFRCNNALGDFGDSERLLHRAAAYLDAHAPEQRELVALARARLAALRA